MDNQVEDANEADQDGCGNVDWEISVEKKQGDEYHEQALTMKESKELEVFEDGLILNLRDEKQSSEWDQVERQDVKEWI